MKEEEEEKEGTTNTGSTRIPKPIPLGCGNAPLIRSKKVKHTGFQESHVGSKNKLTHLLKNSRNQQI
jgi:hypothetical protein